MNNVTVMQANQLQNLGWWDDIKADAAADKAKIAAFNAHVKTAIVADATKAKAGISAFNGKVKAVVVADASKVKAFNDKVKTAVVTDASKAGAVIATGVKTVATDLMLDGKACGTNPVCQELARYGVNVNHHINHIVIENWLKTGQYGQWCASNNICLSAVKEAQHDFTHGERQAVNNWLHPAHTEASLLQNLGWWADIKADAAAAKAKVAAFNAKVKADAVKALHFTEAAGHDLVVAGEKCGSNKICSDIALKGADYLEGKETTLVMGWVNSNQKAAWCKSNNICMEIVNKALSTATVEETHLVSKWLHQSAMTVQPAMMVKPTMIMLI